MSRRSAREILFKLVFEYTFTFQKNEGTKELFLTDATLSDDDKAYIEKAYDGVTNKYEELVSVIEKYAEGYAVSRIYRPDLVALVISVYELKYMQEIPPSVSISEAVEIVKRYSTEKSNSFVNGILASVYKEIKSPGL